MNENPFKEGDLVRHKREPGGPHMRVVGNTDASMGRFVHVHYRKATMSAAQAISLAHHDTFREEDLELVKKAESFDVA